MASYFKLNGLAVSQGSLPPKMVNGSVTFFFADDSLLFCKANSVEWRRLMKILEKYEVASGQKLNPSKTSIFF